MASVKNEQILACDGFETGLVPQRIAGIGVVAIQLTVKRLLDDGPGRLRVPLQGHQRLRPLTLQILRGKRGRGQDLREQIERRIQQGGIRQAAQTHAGHVTINTGAELGAHALETAGDVVRALVVGSFIQHRGRQAGNAAFFRRIAAGTGIEHHAHLQHRQLAALDEIHACAVIQLPMLDFGAGVGIGRRQQQADQEQDPGKPLKYEF